ncbi:MAG: CatB-related O-acetyltransferase [Magnetococcales bacterium]|nr:CatB-related O-acetyltransferase [Magnetococcales bacterium]MBF0116254.1 CatB-related O-acetyltransferase [Magnetococcales bacterium]
METIENEKDDVLQYLHAWVNFQLLFGIYHEDPARSNEQIKKTLTGLSVNGAVVDKIIEEETKIWLTPRYTAGLKNITLSFLPYLCRSRLTVGSFCSFAQNIRVILSNSTHTTKWVTTRPLYGISWLDKSFNLKNTEQFAPQNLPWNIENQNGINVGNDVWIGASCTIMPDVTIGDGAVIAANSHVVRNVGPYEIVGGNPAKLIRKRFEEHQVQALLTSPWWALSDERIHALTPYLCSENIELAIEKIQEVYASPERSLASEVKQHVKTSW